MEGALPCFEILYSVELREIFALPLLKTWRDEPTIYPFSRIERVVKIKIGVAVEVRSPSKHKQHTAKPNQEYWVAKSMHVSNAHHPINYRAKEEKH